MADKDALFFELVEALNAGGCALCSAASQASGSYLNALLHEGVTDPRLREELRDARGLCHRHAWRMAGQRGSVLGTAIIYRDVVNTLAKALEAQEGAASRWRSGRQDLTRGLAATADCPACRLEADAVRRAARTLLKHLDAPEVEGGYHSAGGLCLPHFREVLSHAGETAARTLAAWQTAAYRALRDELDELIRKHDYRFAGEPVGQEGDSWQRAVALVVGRREA